jgi:hypothetical protein
MANWTCDHFLSEVDAAKGQAIKTNDASEG